MLSIFRIQNTAHALNYYQKDNYYTKNQAEENTQWYGKGADELGLTGMIKFKDFEKALHGLDKDGRFLSTLQNKKIIEPKEREISLGTIAYLESNFDQMASAFNVSKETIVFIKQKLKKLKHNNERKTEKILSGIKKSIFSKINKDINIKIDHKDDIKKLIEDYLSEFAKDRQRRVGFDLTFSAPKSVSLAALVGKDEELLRAHREAVKVALDFIEKEYAQTRVRSQKDSTISIENTNNILAATFEHDTSRKIDPQLHTHCVLLNATKRQDGKWCSIHQDGFYYNSKHCGIIYQNELAKRVKALGYEIRIQKNGTFEIKGYTEEQLQYFSKRSQQLKEMGAVTQKDKTKFVKINRDKKDEELSQKQKEKIWKEESKSIGLVHPQKSEKKVKYQSFQLENVIRDSILELTKNDITFRREALETSVINKMLGDVHNYKYLKKQVQKVINNESKKVVIKSRVQYVPNYILKLEEETISIMRRGKGVFESILSSDEARRLTENVHQKSLKDGFDGLLKGQKEAIELFLTTQDRFMTWEGVAGAGKSFSLGVAKEIAEKNSYIVKGFSPQSSAAKVLAAEAKLKESNTVASLLVSETGKGRAKGNEIWIVDEAGMLSAKDAHELLKKAEIENARVVLVGHTKQLSSIGAGNPFKQLQDYGIATAQLNESVRQKEKTMKVAVDLLANGEHKKGIQVLDQAGKVFENKNVESIISNMAQDYLSLVNEERKKSLFISSTNYEKEEITNLIRSELKVKEEIKNTVKIKALIPLESNEHALKYASTYQIGDVVVPHRNFKSFRTTETGNVVDISHKENIIFVETKKGLIKSVELGAKNGGLLNIFREKELEIGVGDKIKWTKNHSHDEKKFKSKAKNERRLNGVCLTVQDIDLDKMTAVFEDEKGKKENVDLKNKQYIDHSYVSTVFSSQGRTCDKVYASVTRVDSENAYVAISRARYDTKIYSTDKEMFYKNVEKIGSNKTAKEIVSSYQNESGRTKETDNKQEKNFSKINRKIVNYSIEMSHDLNINPDGFELSKHFPLGQCQAYDDSLLDLDKPIGAKNSSILKEIMQEEVNKSLGIKKSSERLSLNSEKMENIFENELEKIKKISMNKIKDKLILKDKSKEKEINKSKIPLLDRSNGQQRGYGHSR